MHNFGGVTNCRSPYTARVDALGRSMSRRRELQLQCSSAPQQPGVHGLAAGSLPGALPGVDAECVRLQGVGVDWQQPEMQSDWPPQRLTAPNAAAP